MADEQNIMIIAGEVSGDLHGSALMNELYKLNPNLRIYGVGGDKMEAAGMQQQYHIDKMAFLGFVEVIKHIPFIKKVQRKLIETIKSKGIKTVVLIDYPGFNLSIAKKIKSLKDIQIIYYISPQIWAWGGGRINKIKRLVDKMIVLFPFEELLYKNNNVDVNFVGHPIVERIASYNFLGKEELAAKLGLDNSKELILVMAGSRVHEVEKIFPAAIEAADRLAKEYNMQIVAACPSNINEELLYSLSGNRNFKLIKGFTYELMKYSKVGIIKSGTSTLEAGLLGLPMVIVYKTTGLTYMIGKSLIKLKNIGLVNIVSGKKVVPELIQSDANSENIYNEIRKILLDKKLYNSIKYQLSLIKSKLGSEGASRRAASIILNNSYDS